MKSGLLTILSTALLTSLNCMAIDTIFMQVSDIPGTATETNHDTWHPLTSVNWGVERAVEMTDLGTTQRSYANSNFSKIELTRQHDHSTPHFFLAVAGGTVRPEIILHFTRAGDSASEGLQAYMIIKLKNVIIDKLTLSATENGIPEETMSIAYTAIEIITKKTDLKTGKLTTASEARWNLMTGKSEY